MMRDLEKLRETLGAVSIKHSYSRDCVEIHFDDGCFIEVDSQDIFSCDTDDALREVCRAATRRSPSYDSIGPVDSYDSLGIVGKRTDKSLRVASPEEIDLAARQVAIKYGLVIQPYVDGRGVYFQRGNAKLFIQRDSAVYSLVKPGDMLHAVRSHIAFIIRKHGPGRVWFLVAPALATVPDEGCTVVGDRILLRTYYGHEAQAVVKEVASTTPAFDDACAEVDAAFDDALVDRTVTKFRSASPCPICGATDHEKITTAMGTFVGCPQQSKYSVVMSPQPEKIKVAFAPIAEETAESAAPADTIEALARDIWEAGNEFRRAAERESAHELYVYECFALLSARGQDAGFTGPERRRVLSSDDEIVARAEWSHQLRDLQAEARRKEREQVVLDMDWEP